MTGKELWEQSPSSCNKTGRGLAPQDLSEAALAPIKPRTKFGALNLPMVTLRHRCIGAGFNCRYGEIPNVVNGGTLEVYLPMVDAVHLAERV